MDQPGWPMRIGQAVGQAARGILHRHERLPRRPWRKGGESWQTSFLFEPGEIDPNPHWPSAPQSDIDAAKRDIPVVLSDRMPFVEVAHAEVPGLINALRRDYGHNRRASLWAVYQLCRTGLLRFEVRTKATRTENVFTGETQLVGEAVEVDAIVTTPGLWDWHREQPPEGDDDGSRANHDAVFPEGMLADLDLRDLAIMLHDNAAKGAARKSDNEIAREFTKGNETKAKRLIARLRKMRDQGKVHWPKRGE